MANSKAKTRPTRASIADYIASRANDEQRADCAALISRLSKITGQKPKMWGPSIVGFGSYRYQYASGGSGEACATGFAIRGKELVVYLLAESESQHALLGKLGKYRLGKSCLYFKRLAEIDIRILEKLVTESVAELRRRYPDG